MNTQFLVADDTGFFGWVYTIEDFDTFVEEISEENGHSIEEAYELYSYKGAIEAYHNGEISGDNAYKILSQEPLVLL